ncbi:MAG: trypsin-like peptidase domain-containing protein, partial [Alphaproteobacteria bacterium]
VEPRPSHLVARTRVIRAAAPEATRVVSATPEATRVTGAAGAPIAASTQAPETPPRQSVGRETVQRMLSAERQATSRVWMYMLAGILVVVGVVGGALYYHSVQTEEMLKRQQAEATAQAQGQAAALKDRLGMSSKEIIAKYGDAAVYIEIEWRLYDRQTGKPLFHKVVSDGGKLYLGYVKLESGKVVRWLTTDDNSHTNRRVGVSASGSGFVVSPEGFILTNKHVAAGWMIPYSAPIESKAGIGMLYLLGRDAQNKLVATSKKVINPEDYDDLTDWIPENGGYVFDDAYPLPIANGAKVFEGRNDTLDIRFPENRLSFAARLIRASTDADVALIRIDAPQKLVSAELAEPNSPLTVGEQVTVLGYPGISEETRAVVLTSEGGTVRRREEIIPQPTVTEGIISKLGSGVQQQQQGGSVTTLSELGDTYQLTVLATGHGNSGGPVFNSAGKVIGLFTYSRTNAALERVTFAVPIKYGRDIMQLQRVQ